MHNRAPGPPGRGPGGWPMGVLHQLRAGDRRPEATPRREVTAATAGEHILWGLVPGRPGLQEAAIVGADAWRQREPPALERADPAREAPPLLANIYTYSNSVSPHSVDPGGFSSQLDCERRWPS